MCVFKIHCTHIGNYQIIKDVYIAKAGFGLLVFLTPSPKCWGYSMCHSLCPDNVWENLENRVSQDSNLSTATISLVKKCWSRLTRPAMISKHSNEQPLLQFHLSIHMNVIPACTQEVFHCLFSLQTYELLSRAKHFKRNKHERHSTNFMEWDMCPCLPQQLKKQTNNQVFCGNIATILATT